MRTFFSVAKNDFFSPLKKIVHIVSETSKALVFHF